MTDWNPPDPTEPVTGSGADPENADIYEPLEARLKAIRSRFADVALTNPVIDNAMKEGINCDLRTEDWMALAIVTMHDQNEKLLSALTYQIQKMGDADAPTTDELEF